MKILFLCGSLEPGKCGVGDYTRRLSGELIRQGHSASIIALNDRHINAIIQTTQKSDEATISVLRLPSRLSNKERYEEAGKLIAEFNPEWLSLQYVPYSFQKRGLAWRLLPFIRKVQKQGIKFCVMVHEPYVRIDDDFNPVHIVIALLQRIILKKILYLSRFAMTSIKRYSTLLNRWHKYLIINPIPPNILPVIVNTEDLNNKKKEYLEKLNVSKIIAIFGDRNIDSVINTVRDINNETNLSIGVLIVGRIRDNKYSDTNFVIYTGILSEHDVSLHLQIADLFVLPERVYKNNRGGATFKSGALSAALATSLPILTSKGDMTEHPPLIHSENIWFTDFHNEQILKQDIVQLFGNKDLLYKLRKGSFKLYNEYLNWELVSHKYIEQFNAL
jgi:glycosyltransferase involved in cell wall biosynthesis